LLALVLALLLAQMMVLWMPRQQRLHHAGPDRSSFPPFVPHFPGTEP
jgi:hypothetical protein